MKKPSNEDLDRMDTYQQELDALVVEHRDHPLAQAAMKLALETNHILQELKASFFDEDSVLEFLPDFEKQRIQTLHDVIRGNVPFEIVTVLVSGLLYQLRDARNYLEFMRQSHKREVEALGYSSRCQPQNPLVQEAEPLPDLPAQIQSLGWLQHMRNLIQISPETIFQDHVAQEAKDGFHGALTMAAYAHNYRYLKWQDSVTLEQHAYALHPKEKTILDTSWYSGVVWFFQALRLHTLESRVQELEAKLAAISPA